MTTKPKAKPLRNERYQAYCVDGCSDRPVEHERKLYPGRWKVRCLNCLAERIIGTLLGLDGLWLDFEQPNNERRPQRGSAAAVDALMLLMEEEGVKASTGDTFTLEWIGSMLDLRERNLTRSAVAKRIIDRGLAVTTGRRGVYRWA